VRRVQFRLIDYWELGRWSICGEDWGSFWCWCAVARESASTLSCEWRESLEYSVIHVILIGHRKFLFSIAIKARRSTPAGWWVGMAPGLIVTLEIAGGSGKAPLPGIENYVEST
jgi:hypothetical protein